MGGKRVISLRFNTEGIEGELYEKIQQGRMRAKLSLPDYVKVVLHKYFHGLEKQNFEQEILYEVQKLSGQVERLTEQQKTMLMGANGNWQGKLLPVNEYSFERLKDADLPDEGEDIPSGVLDFLSIG